MLQNKLFVFLFSRMVTAHFLKLEETKITYYPASICSAHGFFGTACS
jgi:hypothetical protein